MHLIYIVVQAVIFVNFYDRVFHVSVNHCILDFPGGLLVILLQLLDESFAEPGARILQLVDGRELPPQNFVLVDSPSVLDHVEGLAGHQRLVKEDRINIGPSNRRLPKLQQPILVRCFQRPYHVPILVCLTIPLIINRIIKPNRYVFSETQLQLPDVYVGHFVNYLCFAHQELGLR